MHTRPSPWDWLIARALLSWQRRVLAGAVRMTGDDARKLGFEAHLRRLYPLQTLRLSATDVDGALDDFLREADSLLLWHQALLNAADIGIDWSEGQPWIEMKSLQHWTVLCNDFDADATLTLAWALRNPSRAIGTGAMDAAALARWRTVPRSGDNELRVLAKRGLADMHIHAGGVRIFQQAWVELMAQRFPASNLKSMAAHYRARGLLLTAEIDLARASRRQLAAATSVDLVSEARGLERPTAERWFSWSPGQLRWERSLLIAGWRNLIDAPNDEVEDNLAAVLDTYVYRKNRFYRWARQPVLSDAPGLRVFERVFLALKQRRKRGVPLRGKPRPKRRSRAKKVKKPIAAQAYAESHHLAMAPMGDACRYLLETDHLVRMELRIGPLSRAPDYWREFRLYDQLKERLRHAYPDRKMEIRFAVHFKRSGDHLPREPDREPDVFRRLRELDRDTAALRAARADRVECQHLKSLARIDVAGQERDTPINVYALHLQLLRGNPGALDTLERAAWLEMAGKRSFPFLEKWLSLHKRGLHRPLGWEAPLGLTVHAGEDYADPLDGIYQVATALDVCGLSSGDAIGHGLALVDPMDTDPDELGPRLPRGAAFDSQCWLLDFLEREHAGDGLWTERRQLEKLIEEDGQEIFRRAMSVSRLLNYWRSTRSPDPAARDDRRPAFADQLRDRRIYLAREELTDADRRNSLRKAVLLAQKSLIRRIGREGVIIEVNPSSNARISGVDALHKNPSVALLKASHKDLRISINTDDPGVFAGVIENEYALLLNSVRRESDEFDEATVRTLLEAARHTGLDILR